MARRYHRIAAKQRGIVFNRMMSCGMDVLFLAKIILCCCVEGEYYAII